MNAVRHFYTGRGDIQVLLSNISDARNLIAHERYVGDTIKEVEKVFANEALVPFLEELGIIENSEQNAFVKAAKLMEE